MSILAVGLSHRTADLRTLERAALAGDELTKGLHDLAQAQDVGEAMLLSTCNRVEVYAAVDSFHGGLAGVSEALARMTGLDVAELHESVYVHYAGAAVEHLFSVTCGLDSMVVGETQIQGQVRAAYAAAREADTIGRSLHDLVQTTLRVGKRVHTDTELGSLGASVVSKALEVAGEATGGLAGRSALVVGAGAMGALTAAQLRGAGIGELTVANRTLDRAKELADSVAEHDIPARTAALADVPSLLPAVDLVVCCTGAGELVLGPHELAGASLVICDLGLPRNVDPALAEHPGMKLVDLETVRSQVAEQRGGGQAEAAAAIVAAEVREYLAGAASAAVTPTVAALRRQASDVVDAELLRLERRLPELAEDSREEIARTVRRVVDKLLHAPTVRVKQLAAQQGTTDYAGALRELFGLDPAAPATLVHPASSSPEAGSPQAGSPQTGSPQTGSPQAGSPQDEAGAEADGGSARNAG